MPSKNSKTYNHAEIEERVQQKRIQKQAKKKERKNGQDSTRAES